MILRLKTLFGFLVLLSFFSCGGGESLSRDDNALGGNTGGDSTITITRSIQLAFTDASGQTSTALSESNPLTLTATATDSNGDPVTDTLITYTFQPEGLAIFGNDSGTSSTDINGVAMIDILVGESSGSGEIIATLSSGETAVTTFKSTGTVGDATVNRIMQLELTDSMTGEMSSELSEGTPLTLTTSVTDSNGDSVPSTLITYIFQPEGLAVFGNDSGTASTDSDGVATLEILVGENSGAGEIIAALSSGETQTTTFTSAGKTRAGEQPASLDLFGSSIQLASSGSDNIELIALVKDANNVLLEGVAITFSANADASLQVTQGISAADGTARATLTTQNNQENRIIEVMASTATFSKILSIDVVGTRVNVNGASSAIIDAPVPLTINLVDSDGKGIANQSVVASAVNGTLSDTAPVTSNSGQVTIEYFASTSGQDTIFVKALNSQASFDIIIQQDDFAFTALPISEVALNEPGNLTLTWLKDGVAFEGGDIYFTSSRGLVTSSDSQTDVNGKANFEIESNNAGFASISAKGIDSEGNEVSARAEIEFVATLANNIIVDGTPDSVAPDGQTSTITAVLRDAAGNLVKGKVINFLVDDVSGGNISVNQATTDRKGIASTVYTSNAVSAFEAVKIYATVDDDTSISSFTSLTVGDRAFDISIGTGRLINTPTDSSYSKEFSVFVTDPDSNPVENVNLTFSATPEKFVLGGVYRKGLWTYSEDQNVWFVEDSQLFECQNEDINGNGILDSEDVNDNKVLDVGEDTNGNGELDTEDNNGDGQLTPGNVATVPASGVTDQNGQMLFDISYAKQFGRWVDITITVSGESAGTEASETQNFSLIVAAADLTDESSPPPNSPYGVGPNCFDTN